MSTKGKISTFQMFSVLFLSRMISLFTFMLPSASYLPEGDRIITALPVMLIEGIYALVLLYSFRKNNNKSLIQTAYGISPLTAKIISVIYTLVFIGFLGINTARFELFISTVMFPNSELTIMILLLLGASVYAALKGIEAIGRASVILLGVTVVSVFFILLSVTQEFEYTNLKPLFTDGINPVFAFAFYVSARSAELLSLNTGLCVVKGNVKKMIFLWLSAFSILCTVILTFLAGVTGEYGNDQLFPLYTLTVIAEFGIFERLDDILTGIWVLCSFVQTAYLLFLCLMTLKQGFGRIKKLPTVFICTAGVFIVYWFTSDTVTRFSETVSSGFFTPAFITVMLAIPLTVTLIKSTKKRGRTKI